jgi:putative FmdB family regulatory protein
MPIFEFRCRQCGRKTTALVLSRDRAAEVRCSRCGGGDLEKLFSRFATPRSEEARMEALADPSAMSGFDENDPASMERWMKKMGKELGEDAGEEFDRAREEGLGGGQTGSDDSGSGEAGGF